MGNLLASVIPEGTTPCYHLGEPRLVIHVFVDARTIPDGFLAEADICSSVFPTSGSANPTLTIVALAIRLAEHVDRSLCEGGIVN